MPKVYLTGAGPGDVELLTLKAVKAIQNADILIYDRLVNPEILELAKKECELIYVGKEDKKHTLPQEDINKLIYQASLKYENVVRLKGGDPFVFGRGAEEALYLKQKGIKFEIIPGITSAIAVPAYAGIPVTHRGLTTSFRVVTGHENPKKKISQIEWETFLNDETIIFLMGYHNIEIISSKLLSLGKRKDYPCAVISKGTTTEQKVVVGTLEDIVEKSKDLPTPVMILIGEVVNLREQISWFN
ncbi:uroporphyrinogen-III C-methyltransferase [Aliarcobacter butzleri]|uniref:uroporphyrinogen-III C-methyltransferase n=1 Tax=Aliarcobacter butzleri TaxID=28197 RepID=A0AAP4UYV0_9BACT|nr:uroporphyrinogen-III C-methyltransferase [Aliarcobacter butzleri]MCG3682257.1 uroporphyrinogen-III C-methyltransferase [Aliarcobacter butzleri]MDN5052027.1 uroporphyrinogen-III C-methyltransferase [Aliarcobacter butzleri]MDN5075882.1 uroporphyrinogen-III C-methyltransferase [Aliarcobacter butzleri]MDN5116359.1 uroporphyrinogen-III C-methyltransferase [Aliarcobacter butzleri]MDN5132217.1 uroporphyrinogen-III C-methyltransferase [Aliarcobacter butzleri]